MLYRAGETQQAEAEARAYAQHLQTYLEAHPDQWRPHAHMVLPALVAGDLDSARRHWATATQLRRPDAVLRGQLASAWADTFAVFGDAETAFALMEEALRIPNGYTWEYVRLNSAYDDLRDDPRYAELEQRYGRRS